MLTKLIESHTALFNVLCDLPIPVSKHALADLLIAIILIDEILFAVILNAVIKIAVTLHSVKNH